MRRYQIVPERNDGRDLGWLWVKGREMVHYYRSRQGTTLAMSHCGLIDAKNLLSAMSTFTKCNYCEMIENLRDNQERQDKTQELVTHVSDSLKNMSLDYSDVIFRARSMKG